MILLLLIIVHFTPIIMDQNYRFIITHVSRILVDVYVHVGIGWSLPNDPSSSF